MIIKLITNSLIRIASIVILKTRDIIRTVIINIFKHILYRTDLITEACMDITETHWIMRESPLLDHELMIVIKMIIDKLPVFYS